MEARSRPNSVWKPEGARVSYIRDQELNEKYSVVRSDQAQTWWQRQFAAAPEIETKEVHIIAGAILPLWQKLKTRGDAKLRVVRVSTDDGQRIVGVEIPRSQVPQVLRTLGLGRPLADPGTVFHAVLDGEGFQLVCEMKLKRVKLHGEPAMELICSDPDRFDELRNLGLINEQVSFRQRFFVPSDPDKGVPILTELLDRYPIVETDEASEGPKQENLSIEVPASEARTIVLEQWVDPPEQPVDAAPSTLIAPEEALHEEIIPADVSERGAPLAQLLEQRAQLHSRRQPRSRPIVEGQGLLFTSSERADAMTMPEGT